MSGPPTFDFEAFVTEVDRKRNAEGLTWYDLAAELWQQSHELNERLGDSPL